MKKLIIAILVISLVVMFSFPAVLLGEENNTDECLAAPDIAGQLLEEAGVDARYGSGRDGGNYIRDVAQTMTNKAAFPAYNWYGDWDGETFIEKCDEEAYYQAVYNYLVGLGAGIPTGLSIEYVVDIADGFVCQEIKDLEGNYPTAIVKDVHGNPVEGLEMKASLIREKDFPGSEFTDANGEVIFEGLSYETVGTYQLRIWVKDSEIRNWTGTSALSSEFQLSHDIIGTWSQTVGTRSTSLIVIDEQQADGTFTGKRWHPDENIIWGNIEGTVVGDIIEMHYNREGYVDDGYFAEYEGIMVDCDTASGISRHGNDGEYRGEDGEPAEWNMIRQ
ncbi:MAG: Ig-like domain-containing protein [Actinomycetia bacterium]|nr:Ig-like domain-containing protein [Actinomycetes bacterium]